jgi:hypothetical protein
VELVTGGSWANVRAATANTNALIRRKFFTLGFPL